MLVPLVTKGRCEAFLPLRIRSNTMNQNDDVLTRLWSANSHPEQQPCLENLPLIQIIDRRNHGLDKSKMLFRRNCLQSA
jgi:hypothetical protein